MVDAALIAAARRVEGWEIATYGTMATYAERLGESEVAELLHKTLEEERRADERLSALAEQLEVKGKQDT